MQYVLGGVSTVITGLLLWAIKAMISESKKMRLEGNAHNNAMCEGMLCILRIRLIEYHKEFTDRGSIPSYALDNWVMMYDAYHGLGGNGMASKMDEDIRYLPIKK